MNIQLPEPTKTGGTSLLESIAKRRSGREFTNEPLDLQTLSTLLWASWGRNRKKGRTAPSAHNSQEIDIYVALPSGYYLYQVDENLLLCIGTEDIRALCGTQQFPSSAACNLIFVANLDRLHTYKGDEAICTAFADTGYISQNTYLYCSSVGLSSVGLKMIERETLSAKLNLGKNCIITLSHSIGHPAPRV